MGVDSFLEPTRQGQGPGSPELRQASDLLFAADSCTLLSPSGSLPSDVHQTENFFSAKTNRLLPTHPSKPHMKCPFASRKSFLTPTQRPAPIPCRHPASFSPKSLPLAPLTELMSLLVLTLLGSLLS